MYFCNHIQPTLIIQELHSRLSSWPYKYYTGLKRIASDTHSGLVHCVNIETLFSVVDRTTMSALSTICNSDWYSQNFSQINWVGVPTRVNTTLHNRLVHLLYEMLVFIRQLNDFFYFCHCQVQIFISVQMRPKFCGQLFKVPKAKVNKIHQN